MRYTSFVVVPCTFASIRTRPTEGSDAHTFDRHYPNATNDILLIVNIFGVDALTIEYAYLIVQEVASIAVLEEVALELQTDVASIG